MSIFGSWSSLRIAIGVMAGVTALAAGYGLYHLGMTRGMSAAALAPSTKPLSPGGESRAVNATQPLKAGDVDPTTGKTVLYWHDPMVPGQRFEQPGQSPFMNMTLVPVYAGDGGDEGRVSVSPRVQQNLGIRTTQAARRSIAHRVEAVGNIAFNERDQVIVQARATAFIEQLHVRATLDRVAKGQPLAELYVPDWIAAQEEFLSVRRFRDTALAELIDAARQRLRQAGMTEGQIRLVESRGAVQPRITLTAPIDGVIVELLTREGMTVMPGETLFRINGLSTVWVNAAVPESQAALLRPGAAVEAHSPAVPGTIFAGTVQAILPDVDAATRTIKARIELANPDQALAPGMFVNVALGVDATEVLAVPSEAVIRTGTRTVVIVADGDGRFHPVDVEVGAEAGGDIEIVRGLDVGQIVVVSGQFLIDSEASLRATGTRMEGAPGPSSTLQEHAGEGTITVIDVDTVTLSHGPIPSMQWGAMSMPFIKPPGAPRTDLQTGQTVRFAFTMGEDGKPRLTRIEPVGNVR
jgi:Cu(I)/Ag(I) efflux system membrane fusion protein